MNTPDIISAQPPDTYRMDYPTMGTEQAIDHDLDLMEKFLAGPEPELPGVEYPDPFEDIDPDAIREYKNHMEELRELRTQQSYRELGMDYEIDF